MLVCKYNLSVRLSISIIQYQLIPTMKNNRQETFRKAAHNYRQSLRRSLEFRLESARATGNEKLVRQLEAEANYLHLH